MSSKGLKSSREKLKFFIILEKEKISDLLYLITRLNCLKREEMILTIKKFLRNKNIIVNK